MKGKVIALGITLAALGLVASAFVGVAFAVEDKFLFNTTINGVDCSLMTAEQAEEVYMTKYFQNMNFTIKDDYNGEFKITKNMFDFSDAENPSDLIKEVNKFDWVRSLFNPQVFTTTSGSALDKIEDIIVEQLPALNSENFIEPVDARLEFNKETKKYEIIPETEGTALDEEVLIDSILYHIQYGAGDINISDIDGLYSEAKIKSNNPDLIKLRDDLNKELSFNVTYDVRGNTEYFNADDIMEFITVDLDNFTYSYDKEAAADKFVNDISFTYDTAYRDLKFTTSLGDEVIVPAGNRGWALNLKGTKDKLLEYMDQGGNIDGEVVWRLTAKNNGNYDFFNYVEIDLTSQHLWCYKNGKLVVDCDIVSGSIYGGNKTPSGRFALTYKTRDAVLRGQGYESPVSYWMPFNGDIGMHDASWRSRFGGTIYKYNGSHGCINMPTEAAKKVYNAIDSSFAVICYYRT